MAIIPHEWVKKEENWQEIRNIFDKYFSSDINPMPEKAIEELEAIGETEISKKLKAHEMHV